MPKITAKGHDITDLVYLHQKVNFDELFNNGDDSKIYEELQRTLIASEKWSTDKDTVLFASETTKRILTIVKTSKNPLPLHFFEKLILYIKRVWDYQADIVCHEAVDIFTIMINLHLSQCVDCLERKPGENAANCDWINEIVQWLLEFTTLTRSRFKCLLTLVNTCPTLAVNLTPDFFSRVYHFLANLSLSSVTCELIICHLLDNDDLWDFHVMSIRTFILKNDTNAIKKRLLPMIAKKAVLRPFIQFLLDEFKNSEIITTKEWILVLELCRSLINTQTMAYKSKKEAKNAPILSWVDFIEQSRMQDAIIHVDTEVSISAWKLIVEHPKKTFPFTEVDIEMMKLFLDANMTVQSTAAAQSILATLKLALLRIGESSEQVLKHYKNDDRVEKALRTIESPFHTLIEKAEQEAARMKNDPNEDPEIQLEREGRVAWARQRAENYSQAEREQKFAAQRSVLLRLDSNEFDMDLEQVLPEMTNVLLCKQFVEYLAKKAFDSLSPKGNYHRRIMALMMIEILYKKEHYIAGGKDRFEKFLRLDSTLATDKMQMVLRCLDDSYDLCQSTALRILKNVDFGQFLLNEDEYLKESISLMSSHRSKNSSASAYRMQYFLLRHPERLQPILKRFVNEAGEATKMAEESLMNITSTSVHPLLNTIELLLEISKNENFAETSSFWTNFIAEELLPICHRIVAVVTPVVHNASPEGYIPESTVFTEDKLQQRAELSQLLLVCCWRAHKHISSIFSWILRVVAPLNIIQDEDVDRIGNFYWTQLTECKHRGAFECAVEGFVEMCKFWWKTDTAIPEKWLDEILDAINGEGDFSNLCSTRRSAGLPHLVVSIVSTEPNNRNCSALRKATKSLLNMTDKQQEYRIHSLNVMKAIVSSSALSEKVTFALEETFLVAINACRAEWSERNAASQLFAALKTRIFGVSRTVQRNLLVDAKNKQSNYEFFSKFPSLYRFLYNQLKQSIDDDEFSLLPTLVVLTHLSSPPSSSNVFPLSSFVVELMRISLKEKRENLRSHAIAAILSIADIDVKADICEWIENFDFTNSRQNHIHCFLMLIDGLDENLEINQKMKMVVKKVMESLAFTKWCDYNLNLLFILANKYRIEYDVDEVSLDIVCLTKRPIAERLLSERDTFKTEMSQWLKDREIRKEVYRLISKRGWEVCGKYLCAYIIKIAIDDLATSNEPGGIPQCEAKIIMDILPAADKFMNDDVRKRLGIIVENILSDKHSRWTLGSTKSAAMQIKYMNHQNLYDIDDELIEWIENCFESEDFDAKEISLNVGCRFAIDLQPNLTMSPNFYKPLELRLVEAVAMYLQDDDEGIRKKASVHLSHLVNCSRKIPLNAAVCWLLINKWVLKTVDQREEYYYDSHFEGNGAQMPDRDDLFDACAVNSFSEHAFFGDIKLYETLLQRMTGAVDVFELEMD